MTIKKFLHSCLLLEKDGKRLLIDPGLFSFIEERIKPEDIGAVDAILLTHNHQDHFDLPTLKKFLTFGSPHVFTIEEIGSVLKQNSIDYERVTPGDRISIEGFETQVFHAAHGSLPFGIPDNVAYLIDGLLHPGDSFNPEGVTSCETLALPIAGPWATLDAAVVFSDRLHPKRIIPIHDAILKDFMLTRIYDRLTTLFKERGIEFTP